MKKISYWAKAHKTKARIYLVICYIILNVLAFSSGIFFKHEGISFTPLFVVLAFSVFVTAFIMYPLKSNKGKKFSRSSFYYIQKTYDFFVVLSTFCMLIYLGNNPEKLSFFYSDVTGVSITMPLKDTTISHYKPIREFYNSLKDANGRFLKWKERKKLLKEQIKAIRQDSQLPKGEKIVLTILSVLLAAGLIYLVLGLSCNLSCDGYDAAAAIVGIGGVGLTIFLLVIALRAIYGKKKKVKPRTLKAQS